MRDDLVSIRVSWLRQAFFLHCSSKPERWKAFYADIHANAVVTVDDRTPNPDLPKGSR